VVVTKPEETPQGVVALAFARAIAAGGYDLAHSMVSAPLQATTSASQLEEEFIAMIEYAECPPENLPDVEVTEAMNDWPAKQDGDVGWAYVAMSNDYYSEAVTVVVAHEDGSSVIREVEWGRP